MPYRSLEEPVSLLLCRDRKERKIMKKGLIGVQMSTIKEKIDESHCIRSILTRKWTKSDRKLCAEPLGAIDSAVT